MKLILVLFESYRV